MTALSTVEQSRLAEHEAVIERGLGTFVEVGQALLAIRDARLYRSSDATFETYCRHRWGFTPQHAGRIIAAAEIVGELEPIGSIAPATESQARALTPLRDDPTAMAEAMTEASERTNGKLTAAAIGAAVKDRVTPSAEAVAMEEYLADDVDVQATRYRHEIAKAIVRWRDQFTFEPERVAGALDDDDWDLWERTADDAIAWWTSLLKAKPRRLHSIKGGRR